MSRRLRPTPTGAARPAVRRDADGGQEVGPSWESLVERLIREAQDDGRFDDLPGHGRPLAPLDPSTDGDMALAFHLLHNAGVAPPWIEADKAVRTLAAEIERLLVTARSRPPSARARLERQLDELADHHDAAVARLESLAPSPRQHRRRLDRATLSVRLATAFDRA